MAERRDHKPDPVAAPPAIDEDTEETVERLPKLPEDPVEGDPTRQMAFAVHTTTCAYLLDKAGICRWIVTKRGAIPDHVKQCMGAQFVACLDLRERGGLTGELRVGAMGLFVRADGQGRMRLLRTAPIQRVDGWPGAPPPPRRRYGDSALDEGVYYGKIGGIPVDGPPQLSSVQSWGQEQTVSVSTPEPAPGPKPPR